jgi:predicted sugar kinase
LATAEAVSRFVGVSLAPAVLATEIARRGQRSAVGVHGFFSGGLVYEGSTGKCDLNPVIDRVELPARWRVGVFRTTRHVEGVSGELEREQFSNLSAADANARADLSRIVVGQMIPAARRCDFASFTQAVGLYNLASGRLFESVQGGPYNGAVVADLIESLSARGASGVGQSSWGPGVFAWFESQAQMEAVSRDLPRGVRVIAATRPRRGPREMEVSYGGSGHPATRSRAGHDRHP